MTSVALVTVRLDWVTFQLAFGHSVAADGGVG
ncbi:MAG: hypothetical protein JWO59_1922, partial [Chloroflexi bacterium]|nr:hypothetical protein [Chloroflexota bacterium]